MAFAIQRTIDAPIEVVFDWLAEVTNYARVPGIFRAISTSPGAPDPRGVGLRREVSAAGVLFSEEITEFTPPSRIGYVVRRSKPSLPHRGGTIELRPEGDRTLVVWTIFFQVSTPVIGKAATALGAVALGAGFRLILATAARECRRGVRS
ncbi:SRPBCC family protein [Nocardia sp. XZ_19_385]|uniref:SRPBCC family protein n=1 Tax=Nocardia sp. XZ_19_385 TaxID=2769488 RepID=UPI00188DFE6C|nr:SRPBCC family protein [Nocardia sp. XZ_19_385]